MPSSSSPHGFFPSVQGGPDEDQDNPEDPANGPYGHRENNLETGASCSKEPCEEPAAISFLGALRIPVRSLWARARWGLSIHTVTLAYRRQGTQGDLWSLRMSSEMCGLGHMLGEGGLEEQVCCWTKLGHVLKAALSMADGQSGGGGARGRIPQEAPLHCTLSSSPHPGRD